MPVEAVRLIRKMRGGAQAHLLEAADGHFYVVKFSNNPQHRRILVNEWISSVFLEYLGIATPQAGIVQVTPEFLRKNPEVYIQLGSGHRQIEPGWHFGSRCPGDPARMAVYDFLPDTLLEKVENLPHFHGVLVFDQWMGNADSRQSIFFRARIKDWLPGLGAPPLRLGFVAQMVDNGFVFEGPHWRYADSALHGLYFRTLVYRSVHRMADFEPWLERIRGFPEEVVDRALKQIPEAWLEGERDTLEQLLERLLDRRDRVADMIENCRLGPKNPFPAWQS